MSTSNEASAVFVSRVIIKFLILFRSVPKLTDWNSVVLINTKRIMSLINRWIRKGIVTHIYKMSVSSSGFKAEVVVGCEVEF